MDTSKSAGRPLTDTRPELGLELGDPALVGVALAHLGLVLMAACGLEVLGVYASPVSTGVVDNLMFLDLRYPQLIGKPVDKDTASVYGCSWVAVLAVQGEGGYVAACAFVDICFCFDPSLESRPLCLVHAWLGAVSTSRGACGA